MNARSLLSIAVVSLLFAPASFAQEMEPVDATITDPVPTLYEEEVMEESEVIEETTEEAAPVEVEEATTSPSLAETLYQKKLARCKTLQNAAKRRQCTFEVERAERARAPRVFLLDQTPAEARATLQKANQTFREKAEALRIERQKKMEEARNQIRERREKVREEKQAGLSGQAPSYGQTIQRRRAINSAIRGEGAVNTQTSDVEGQVESRVLSTPSENTMAPGRFMYRNPVRIRR